jgi:localization factor PodJL
MIFTERPKAQYFLGTMYELGLGVPKDNATAYKWHTLAAAMGEPDAVKVMQEISKKLDAEQLAKAQQQAADWLDQHKQ